MLKLSFTIQTCILICSFITNTLSFDYCSKTCEIAHIKLKQIICERHYKCSSPAYGCIRFQNTTLSPEDKTVILEEHNRLRNIVALGEAGFTLKNITAADMNELLWDTELETIALCWVNTCGGNEYEYGVCLDTEYAKSGYNVGFKRISVLSNELKSVEALKEHINGWFSEADSFSKELIDDYSNDIPQSKFRRFSQLAWAETIYIGCARSIYGQYITMFACVYSPSGNIDGEAVFTKGPPCSGCKYGKCSKKYEGLCTVTEAKYQRLPTTASISTTPIAKSSTTTNQVKQKKIERTSWGKTETKPDTSSTTKAVKLVNDSEPIVVAIEVHRDTIEVPVLFVSPIYNETSGASESGNAVQPLVRNKACRNDKKFVKDFGLFVVGMVVIFK